MQLPRSDRLVEAIRCGIVCTGARHVIETGTFYGQGSTLSIIEAFGEVPPERLVTIEAKREHWAQATKNLAAYPFVEVVLGLSLGREQAADFIRGSAATENLIAAKRGLKTDHPRPEPFYLDEIETDGPDGWLYQAFAKIPAGAPLLYALDSAGGVGFLEFLEAARIARTRRYALLLDDVNHVKHYRSFDVVEKHPSFRVLDSDGRWAVAVHEPSEATRIQSEPRSESA